MKLKSYWHDTVSDFDAATQGPVSGDFDVAIIGAGFTGLSAARALAKSGVRVVVLESAHVGFGGSGRNGGHLNNGISHSFVEAKAHLGTQQAKDLYRAFDASIDTIERIITDEGIDCDFRRSGKLKLASKPAHFDSIARNFKVVNAEVDSETELLTATDLHNEIGSDQFHGAMLSKKSAMMHMGKFVHGLAEASVRHGAVIFENAPVTARKQSLKGWHLTTPRGDVSAEKIILASGAYTTGPFRYFRRRVVPVGSFVIATRPLTTDEIAATIPGNRTYVTSMNLGNYFRLSPDNRLIFGGRARFSARSDPNSDRKSGEMLRAGLQQIFPHLANVDIDYCWGGLVGMTKDRFPRAGKADGAYFSMGYSGHGAQMSTHMGEILADMVTGKPDRNPMKDMDWAAVPGHFGTPWFLPVVGMYYKMMDRIR